MRKACSLTAVFMVVLVFTGCASKFESHYNSGRDYIKSANADMDMSERAPDAEARTKNCLSALDKAKKASQEAKEVFKTRPSDARERYLNYQDMMDGLDCVVNYAIGNAEFCLKNYKDARLYFDLTLITAERANACKQIKESAILSRGMSKHGLNDYKGAIPDYEWIIANSSTPSMINSAYELLGMCHYSLKNYKAALDHYEAYYKKYPASAKAAALLCEAKYAAWNNSQSTEKKQDILAFCTKVQAQDPKNKAVQAVLLNLTSEKKPGGLFASAAPALDLYPAMATFEEGYAAVEAKDLKKAKERFLQAVKEAPSMGQRDKQPDAETAAARTQILFFSNFFLATIANEERDTNRAAEHLESMLENESACGSKVFYVMPVKGWQDLKKNEAKSPGEGFNKFVDLAMKGLNKFAELNVAMRQKCNEGTQQAYLFLGSLYRSKNEFQRSADMLTKFIQSKPKESLANALALRAQDLFFLKRYPEALADIDPVVNSNPRYADGLAWRCLIKVVQYQIEGKKDKDLLFAADKDCKAAEKIEPSNAIAAEYRPDVDRYLEEIRPGKKKQDDKEGMAEFFE